LYHSPLPLSHFHLQFYRDTFLYKSILMACLHDGVTVPLVWS
jgi:hypothetical protein